MEFLADPHQRLIGMLSVSVALIAVGGLMFPNWPQAGIAVAGLGAMVLQAVLIGYAVEAAVRRANLRLLPHDD